MNNSQKLDHIVNIVNETKIDIATIEQHLKTLNGTVKEHDSDIQWLKSKFWIAVGATGSLTFAIAFVTKVSGLW